MKVCSRCQIEQDDPNFRKRKDKRDGRVYLNNTCKKCDAELQRTYYNSVKENHDFKKKNRKRANDWRESLGDKYAEITKKRRQSKTYKKSMSNYRKKNKAKIYEQEKVTKNRYHAKHRDNVTDEYVSRQLINQDVATRESLKLHPELIEAKRIQILIKRKVNARQN